MQVKGTVDSVYSKTKSTRAGDKTIFYADVDGTEINMGFKPTMEEGEYVNVEVAEKFGELQIVGKGGGKAPAKPSSTGSFSKGPAKSRGGAFPIEPTDSQVSIIRQSSLNRAVETIRDQINAGVLVVNTAEEYEAEVIRLAYEYTDFATGQREVKAAKHKEVQRAALEAVNG